jgi:hypothetical protein
MSAPPPTPYAVFDSVLAELLQLKHKYDSELGALDAQRHTQSKEIADLEASQRTLAEQNEACRRARQDELAELEKKYQAARGKIYDRMRSDAETFSNLIAQNTQHSEAVRATAASSARRRAKLLKRKELVEAREQHVRDLQREYRTNAAQLAHDYASAAVSKVQPDAGLTAHSAHGNLGGYGLHPGSLGYDPLLPLPLPSAAALAGAGAGASAFPCPSPTCVLNKDHPASPFRPKSPFRHF